MDLVRYPGTGILGWNVGPRLRETRQKETPVLL